MLRHVPFSFFAIGLTDQLIFSEINLGRKKEESFFLVYEVDVRTLNVVNFEAASKLKSVYDFCFVSYQIETNEQRKLL